MSKMVLLPPWILNLEALRLLAEERRERLSDKAEAQRRHKDSQGQLGGVWRVFLKSR